MSKMNLNFKVPTWDFIITDPSTPKSSTPKNSSPKISSPKISSPKTASPKLSNHSRSSNMENISLSNDGPSYESGRHSPNVKKTKSVVPGSGSSSPVLKFSYYQVPNGGVKQSPKLSGVKCSPISSPVLAPNSPTVNSINSSNFINLNSTPSDVNSSNIKLELEQRLYKRQYQKILDKNQNEINKTTEREKLLIQQQQIEQQKQQIEIQQQQIFQLTQMHQQNHFFHQSHSYNQNNNNIIFNPNTNAPPQSNINNNFNGFLINNQNNSFINNHNIKINTPKIQTPISSPSISSSSPSSPSFNNNSSTDSIISLPPLLNNKKSNSFPSVDLLLKPSSPSSPSLQNVPSVEKTGFIQLPPIRDEIF